MDGMCKEINEHPSFHGDITEDQAKKLLLHHKQRCYLIRYCSVEKSYKLSVLWKAKEDGKCAHFSISETEGEFKLLSGMLTFYQNNPISHEFDSIGVEVPYEGPKLDVS